MTRGLYLGAVHFDGSGLTVFDACPTKAIHEEFTTGNSFLDAVAAAGLPTPRVDSLGEVRVAHLAREVQA